MTIFHVKIYGERIIVTLDRQFVVYPIGAGVDEGAGVDKGAGVDEGDFPYTGSLFYTGTLFCRDAGIEESSGRCRIYRRSLFYTGLFNTGHWCKRSRAASNGQAR